MSQIVVYPGPDHIKVALFDKTKMTTSSKIPYPKSSGDVSQTIATLYNALALKNTTSGITCYGVMGQEEKPVFELTSEKVALLRNGAEGYEQSNIGGLVLAGLELQNRFLAYPLTYGSMPKIAVLTGVPQLERRFVFRSFDHVFSSKSFCKSIGKQYEKNKGLSVYLSESEFSTAVHINGEIKDATDSFDGEGPMTPTRSGFFQQRCVYKLALSGKMTKDQLLERIRQNGGLLGHLGTKDLAEVRARIASGDEKARVVYEAMIYQMGKSIGKMAVGLKGKPDFFVLTGPLSKDGQLVSEIARYIGYIGKPTITDFNKVQTLHDILLNMLEGK